MGRILIVNALTLVVSSRDFWWLGSPCYLGISWKLGRRVIVLDVCAMVE